MRLSFAFILLLFVCCSVSVMGAEKIKGISFVGSSEPIDSTDVKPIIDINANWVTLMPYGFRQNGGEVSFNTKWQWWGEKDFGVIETIRLCQAKGLKIMLKPQIYIHNKYTGDYKCESESDWQIFENSYRKFILHFSEIASAYNVDLFCLGTEWRDFIKKRASFWMTLIGDVKNNYSGQLTYAANWDDYQKVPFWSELDFIGVNGYFPVSLNKNPGLNEIKKGWQIHAESLGEFAEKQNQKIFFTEIGYRSMIGATVQPWEFNTRSKSSESIQTKAYKALFDVLWDKDWFAGMFIWKWYHNHSKQGGNGTFGFTPQNKPAQELIKKFWGSQD